MLGTQCIPCRQLRYYLTYDPRNWKHQWTYRCHRRLKSPKLVEQDLHHQKTGCSTSITTFFVHAVLTLLASLIQYHRLPIAAQYPDDLDKQEGTTQKQKGNHYHKVIYQLFIDGLYPNARRYIRYASLIFWVFCKQRTVTRQILLIEHH